MPPPAAQARTFIPPHAGRDVPASNSCPPTSGPKKWSGRRDAASGGTSSNLYPAPRGTRRPSLELLFTHFRPKKNGAGDGTRTRDVQLGKLTFCH